MNRREFIKLLGKATVATGLAAVVGLLSDDILYLGEMSDEQWRSAKGEWNGMTLDHQGGSGYLIVWDDTGEMFYSANNGATWISGISS